MNGKKISYKLCRSFAYRAAYFLIFGCLGVGIIQKQLPSGIVRGIHSEYPREMSKEMLVDVVRCFGDHNLDEWDYEQMYNAMSSEY